MIVFTQLFLNLENFLTFRVQDLCVNTYGFSFNNIQNSFASQIFFYLLLFCQSFIRSFVFRSSFYYYYRNIRELKDRR